MKKTLITLLLILSVLIGHAQVMNPGFEQLDPIYGPLSHWRPTNVVVVVLDTACITKGTDSTLFATRDAHAGLYAAELRTAVNCNIPYSGQLQQVRFNTDTFADQRVPFGLRPPAFTFFYKLLPVGSDGVLVEATLEEDDGTTVADAHVKLYGPTPVYSQAIIPLTYRSSATPQYLNIRYRLYSDSVLHFGSRFLVDDIGWTSTGVGSLANNGMARCYPIPAADVLTISVPDVSNGSTAMTTVTDISGRIIGKQQKTFYGNKIRIDTESLPQGTYFAHLELGGEKYSVRFVK